MESVGFSVTLFKCPDNYQTPMNKLLMEINRKLRYGNFYITEQGDITFRLNYPLIEPELSYEFFDRSIFSVVIAVDRNYRKIAEALYGKFSEEDRRKWLIEIREFIELLS